MFHRFQPTDDGISFRTLPGVANGFYVANSDEHGPTGILDESAEVREVMNRRRQLKSERIKSQVPKPKLYGPQTAKLTLVGWGSSKGAVLQALRELPEVNFVHFNHVWPLPEGAGEMLKDKSLAFIENNLTGQLAGLLKQEFGVTGKGLYRDDGRPFYPEEVIDFVKQLK